MLPAWPLAPPGVHHLQVVVTRGWTAGEHYVWLVGDGRELAAVFRASDRDLVELIGEITHRYYPTVGNPLSDVGYSIVGSFKPPPPPPPPDPGGVPDDVVRQVMEAAAAVHGAGARLDAGLATAHP